MIDPSTIPFKNREDRDSYERFMKRVADLKAQSEADPSVGRRLMQQLGIWDENGQLTAKYRDDADEESGGEANGDDAR